MNNKLTIYVMWQTEPKILDADTMVEINRYIEAYKKASELKIGDDFLFEGGWYLVREITK